MRKVPCPTNRFWSGCRSSAGARSRCIDEPADAGLPLGNRFVPPGEADVVLVFARDRAWLGKWLTTALPAIRPDALLWIAYAKLTSPRAAHLSRDLIRVELAPAHGLDTVSQIAVDADWSALRLKRVAT